MPTSPEATALRAWARGDRPTEAAVELLLRAFGGRFARREHPWVRVDGHVIWIDWTQLTKESTAVYSAGERRLFKITASIGNGDPVDLANAVTALDAPPLDLVLAALAHCAGLGALHPWPTYR